MQNAGFTKHMSAVHLSSIKCVNFFLLLKNQGTTVSFHQVTMARRDALSSWLQQTVAVAAKGDLEAAKLSKSPTKVTLANLSGGDVAEACAGLQARGEHRAALLVAQAGGGGEAARMLNQQLSR